MRNKKLVMMASVMALTVVAVSGCRTSKTTPPPEATTEAGKTTAEDGIHASADEIVSLFGYDVDSVVTLPENYRDLKITYKKPEITEEDANKYIDEKLKEEYPVYEAVNKTTVEKGDAVKISYRTITEDESDEEFMEAYIDLSNEESLNEFVANDSYFYFFGNAVNTDDIVKGLVGKKVGDSFEIVLKGEGDSSDMTYKGTITEIGKAVPVNHESLTDEIACQIAKEYGLTEENAEYETKDGFLKLCKADYEREVNEDYDAEIEGEIFTETMKNTKFNITDEMVEEQRKKNEEELKEYLGDNYEEYMNTNESPDADSSKIQLQYHFLIDALIKDMEVSVDDAYAEQTLGTSSWKELSDLYENKDTLILTLARDKAEKDFVNLIRENNGIPAVKEEETDGGFLVPRDTVDGSLVLED